ncbi:hypothetical protein [Thiorhodococcus mannitoliphagus]|nr:hypothetical protein [Thiorhodococcus mannitoliphagus]
MDGGQSCRYHAQYSSELRALSLKVATTESIREAGIFDSAEDVMMRQQRARKASDDASKKYLALSGLGDEAFWQGDSLYIRKGDVLLVIDADPTLPGQFESSEAMQAAKTEKSLSLSQEVAKAVLSRLP